MSDEEVTAAQHGARSFEERVFARFDAMDARFSSLEAELSSVKGDLSSLKDTVEQRLHDPRPIWEGIQKDLGEINSKLGQIVTGLHCQVSVRC